MMLSVKKNVVINSMFGSYDLCILFDFYFNKLHFDPKFIIVLCAVAELWTVQFCLQAPPQESPLKS